MNRRTFVRQIAAATTSVALPSWGHAGSPLATRIVDTHTHFYDPARQQGVPWPAKGTSLYRSVHPKDWLAVAAPHGVKETVIVEASAWLEDNQWILDLAAQEKCVVGFVGRLSPQDEAFPRDLKRFAANPLFRGIRVGRDFPGNRDKPEFQRGLRLMADLGLELDVNGGAPLHQPVAQLAAEISTLRIVVNHVGGAGDPRRLSDGWRSGMKAMGRQKNVFCKVSALAEQTEESTQHPGSAPRDTAYYQPILDHCWEVFGEDRLLYGSNWPVCEKGGTFPDQFKIVSEYFAGKGREACEKYFWKNSLTAYRWINR
ncbi:MAG: amidohydrolase family protein [Verrucomicrobia bacterium]|nr:amidohydrolase family protein [Verrucomicrobiota bacterium]